MEDKSVIKNQNESKRQELGNSGVASPKTPKVAMQIKEMPKSLKEGYMPISPDGHMKDGYFQIDETRKGTVWFIALVPIKGKVRWTSFVHRAVCPYGCEMVQTSSGLIYCEAHRVLFTKDTLGDGSYYMFQQPRILEGEDIPLHRGGSVFTGSVESGKVFYIKKETVYIREQEQPELFKELDEKYWRARGW